MSLELIAIIVIGISIVGLMLVTLHRMEGRINKRIDDVEMRLDRIERRVYSIDARLRAVEQGQSELKAIVSEHTARFDSVDARLQAVEQGQSELKGSVNTMNQVVLATLQRQIEGEPVRAN